MATVVSAFLIISGMAYSMCTQSNDGVMFGFGAGVGWLLREYRKEK